MKKFTNEVKNELENNNLQKNESKIFEQSDNLQDSFIENNNNIINVGSEKHSNVNFSLKQLYEENEFLKNKYHKYQNKYIKFKAKFKEVNKFMKLMMKMKNSGNNAYESDSDNYNLLKRKTSRSNNIGMNNKIKFIRKYSWKSTC